MAATTTTREVFVYDYSEDNYGVLYLFALTSRGHTVCLIVDNFRPHVYIEYTDEAMEVVREYTDDTKFIRKKKLFYHQSGDGNGGEKLFPYIRVDFKSSIQMYTFCKKVSGKVVVHEKNVPSILKMMTSNKLTPAGWVKFAGIQVKKAKKSICEYEYKVKVAQLKPASEHRLATSVVPKVLSYDIEVYSSNENVMPQASNSSDEIFQISCTLSTGPSGREDYLLTLGPLFEIDGVTVLHYETETDLILGFTAFIQTHNPTIICGYNIMGFDEGYLIDRAKMNKCINKYTRRGMMKNKECKIADINWSSSAMSDRQFRYVHSEGRIVVDLLEIIKRDYRFDSYKLSAVSKHFMNDDKTDLSVKGIFRAYRLAMKALTSPKESDDYSIGVEAIKECGVYCIKDSVLVNDLFYKIQCWTQLSEMAIVCHVNISDLITRGQQLKVFSQVYAVCHPENIVVESDGYIPQTTDKYEGAYVVSPVPGVYDNVVPFDFASLYPTTMIAYNICYSTLVKEPSSISDSLCHVIEWTDEATQNHYKFRFVKSPVGILPRLLVNLLAARKNTRAIMKTLDKHDERQSILEKRQLAYKVSSNSVYGSLGVTTGKYLPFLPGAMCTTAMGRQNIKLAQSHIQTVYDGTLVYGDTDSCYIHFPNVVLKDLWGFCLNVEDEMRKLFPAPIELLFEEAIYSRFFILTKKRYMAIKLDSDLVESKHLLSKGVVLTRRDNAECIRIVYEQIVRSIMQNSMDAEQMKYFLVDNLNKVCSKYYPTKMYCVNKKIGNVDDYKIRELSSDDKKRGKRLKELGIDGDCECSGLGTCQVCEQVKTKTLPAHIILAEKIRARGKLIQAGERIEYLITDPMNIKGAVRDKIEDPEYQIATFPHIKIDTLYYIKLMGGIVDECLDVGYSFDKFVKSQYKIRMQKQKCCLELLDLFSSELLSE
jgi:DNA polymerase elongation subunit (family B)